MATDLDGTALRTDGTVSPRTVAAFGKVEESGAVLAFVTGRPPRWMGGVAAAVRHRGLAICANGALIYDLHTERIVESHLITVEVLEEVVAQLRANVPELVFSVEYEAGFAHESDFLLGGLDRHQGAVRVDSVTARPCAKLLALHAAMGADELQAIVDELVGHLVTATHSSRRGLIEMSAQGVTKASALAAFAAQHGIKDTQTVAFGDMPNDLPMLSWAGTSYAVANAHPDVLAAVDHVTAANDDDGVARVLEELYG
ncbi:HMP-PP hydrolase (pyridoxal phosphatase) Cof, detected in genetic screen for thiamin metabolic genes (PMID:15292217) [[Actinomadura] parvosata subsp. kistnae]|uniref:HAD family hydrolase n=1 Tax=[Actinomadura] parvosata TaxID=1955412 RepID=UPI000D2E0DF1|nr:HAD family hydrolase [Nonomuraea sp. ATCC 55076]SPL94048.1 HMP-PP hydrolase (pyridoxal phosphatase) Cof, detected in genetic screen for thiamin metabolic genes (PMID:15292217) [Actinomadura parvosata subsp. kistnae]